MAGYESIGLDALIAEKRRRAALSSVPTERLIEEKQRRLNMAAGRVQSPGVVAPTNPPPPSNPYEPVPAVAQSSAVSPDYAKVDTGFGPKYAEPVARGIVNAATTIPFTDIGRLGDKVYGPRKPWQSAGAEFAGEFVGAAGPYGLASKGVQAVASGVKGIRGLYTATKLAEDATTAQKAAHLGIETTKAAGRGALFGGVGEGLGQAADAAGRAYSGREGEVSYTEPLKQAGFFAGIDAALTLLPPAYRGVVAGWGRLVKSGKMSEAEAAQKIKALFSNWNMENRRIPRVGDAPEPMMPNVPRETLKPTAQEVTPASAVGAELGAVTKPLAPVIADTKPPVKMIDNASEVTPEPSIPENPKVPQTTPKKPGGELSLAEKTYDVASKDPSKIDSQIERLQNYKTSLTMDREFGESNSAWDARNPEKLAKMADLDRAIQELEFMKEGISRPGYWQSQKKLRESGFSIGNRVVIEDHPSAGKSYGRILEANSSGVLTSIENSSGENVGVRQTIGYEQLKKLNQPSAPVSPAKQPKSETQPTQSLTGETRKVFTSAYGEPIRVGDEISMSFMGAPNNMPKPWKLVDVEDRISSVSKAKTSKITVEAANGKRMTFDYAENYNPQGANSEPYFQRYLKDPLHKNDPLPQSAPVSPAKQPIEPPKPPTEQLAEPPEPQKGTPSLSIRTEADAIAKKLTDDFGDLPEYKTMNMQEQATRAKSLIDADAEQAKRIAMGIEAAPEGLRDASVYEAVKLDALKKGDVETLRQLAVESTVPSKLSAYGQEIKASDSRLLDDPVRVMQDVAKTRQEHAKRTGQRYTSEEVTRLKDKLAEAERKLSERIKTTVGKAYGAKNRIVSTAAYEAAKQKIKASLSTAHAGVPPELLVEVSKIGAYHLEAGTRAFADWSARMIEDLGEKIRPNLEDIWKRVNDDRRLQISLKAQRTRFERETGKYQSKLEGLDFSKPEKRALVLDPETRRLKALRDVAKRNWEAALNSYSSVTKEEATNIVNLSKDMTNKLGELERGGDRLEYGAARVAYENYVNYLKGEQTPLRTLLKAGVDKFKTTAQTNKVKATYDLGVDALKVIVNNSVSMVATLDNSFLGRQGLKTLMTHPTAWWRGATNSFADIWKTLGGKDAHSALMADIYSRPNYLDGTYEKAGILAKVEEQYPSSLPERIPGVGRVFKASENAFTGSAIRMRTGLYDLLAKRAAENGVDMADPVQIKALGKMINALTARGQWGKTGEPAVVRLVMWAPKMLKGNIDVLTAHGGGVGLETPFARKQAAYNLLKIVGETATLMTIANAIKPGSAETDPRSSDFGKIKVGNTRYDITGGAASIVTLASRIATGERKSTNTGQMIPYGTKYGQASELDALVDFLANKTNPPAHVVVDWLRGRDFTGEPFSLGREAYRATTPIAVQQAINLKDDHSANAVAGVILDGLGVNATTYEPKPAKPATPKLPPKPKVRGIGPISQADIDSIPAHIQVKYEGVKSKSGEKVPMTGPARRVLKDLYAESDLYTKILESLT